MDLSAYFKRIGYTEKPSADLYTLRELHYLHTTHIPFENLTPFTHREVSLELPELEEKMIRGGRGGYCFEQNLVFLHVLTALGFTARGLSARVLWNQPEEVVTRRSHMLILVELAGVRYLADVGFGGLTQTAPLELTLGKEQKTTHEDFRIAELDGDFKLEARVAAEWKTLYRFDLTRQFQIDYEVANFFLYTHPTSLFRNTLIAAKPVEEGRYALSGNQLTFYPRSSVPIKTTLGTAAEVREVLTTKFGIHLQGLPDLDTRLESIFKEA